MWWRSGNTQTPTFSTVGAFRDLSPIYEELRVAKICSSPSWRLGPWTASGTRCPTTSARATCSTVRTSGRRRALTFPRPRRVHRRRQAEDGPSSPVSPWAARIGATASPGYSPTTPNYHRGWHRMDLHPLRSPHHQGPGDVAGVVRGSSLLPTTERDVASGTSSTTVPTAAREATAIMAPGFVLVHRRHDEERRR